LILTCMSPRLRSDRPTASIPFSLYASYRFMSMWSELSASPMLKYAGFSIPVYRAVARNLQFVVTGIRSRTYTYSQTDTLSNVAAIHIRRGDFADHCPRLAAANATFASWNLVPGVHDQYVPDNTTAQGIDDMLLRCWPSIPRIVERLRQARSEHIAQLSWLAPRPNRVFLMTNGDRRWVHRLKHRLLDDGWKDVITSMELDVHGVEREVDQEIDIEIARRAALFVGNPFSTLTGIVTAMRTVQGSPAITTRFW